MKLALVSASLLIVLGCSSTPDGDTAATSAAAGTCPMASPACCAAAGSGDATAAATEPMVAHMVFFTLKENTQAARDALVAGCNTHLRGAPGSVYFSAGTICEELARDVNVRDFQVGLHVVFKTKADHDAYQTSEKHQEFIAECKDLWSSVRVFDTCVR